jgi:hypothetical protein
LREAAHQVRGIVSTFSAEAAEVAQRLEDLGAGDQLDSAAATFTDLDGLVSRLDSLLIDLPVDALRGRPV